jgi:Putative lumazine-binding
METSDLIVGAATDYVESWLDGDAERMASCLHPDLAKRAVSDPDSGVLDLDEAPFGYMTTTAVEGGPKSYGRELAVTALHIVDGIASAKVASEPFVDLLHLARFGDRWLIVNALWQDRPRADAASDPSGPRSTLDDYASSWFDRDTERARSVYHPAFVERRDVLPDDGLKLEEVSIDDVVTEVSRGAPEGAERRWEAEVLSVDGDIASGRIAVGPWDTYLHLARFGDRWLIVNILYRTRAEW